MRLHRMGFFVRIVRNCAGGQIVTAYTEIRAENKRNNFDLFICRPHSAGNLEQAS